MVNNASRKIWELACGDMYRNDVVLGYQQLAWGSSQVHPQHLGTDRDGRQQTQLEPQQTILHHSGTLTSLF